jgi:excisionase family DNA binding protein
MRKIEPLREGDFMSPGAVAREVGVSRQRIYDLVNNKTVYSIKSGRWVLIPKDEAELLIASIERVRRPDGRIFVMFDKFKSMMNPPQAALEQV